VSVLTGSAKTDRSSLGRQWAASKPGNLRSFLQLSNAQASVLFARAAPPTVSQSFGALDTRTVLALQRVAGNAAVSALIGTLRGNRRPEATVQRCGSHECGAACSGHATVDTDADSHRQEYPRQQVQRDPQGPTTATASAPAAEELKPLCDFDSLRKAIPEKGDTDPTPGQTEPVDDADVGWLDDIKTPSLADWLLPQIDRQFAVSTLGKGAFVPKRWMAGCEAPARTKVKTIRDPAKRQEAQDKLDKQLALDQVEMAKVHEEFSAKTSIGRLNYRKAFLRTMRCLLGPDPAAKNHFTGLENVTPPGLWLDAEAADSMGRVRGALQAGGHDVPESDVGQGLRGAHLEKHGSGWMGHALGFSVDFLAYENPHITEARTSRLIEMLTGDADRMTFTNASGKGLDYGAQRSVIRTIGEKTKAGEDATADATLSRFLNQVDEQYLKMAQGSRKMQEDLTVLPSANRRQLEELKHDYVDLYEHTLGAQGDLKADQKALDAVRKTARARLAKVAAAAGAKPAKIDDSIVNTEPEVAPLAQKLTGTRLKLYILQLRRTALKDRLPKIFGPWLDRIKREFLDLDGAAAKAGVVAGRLPDMKGGRFEEIEAKLGEMAKREGDIPRASWASDRQLALLRAPIARDLAKITAAIADQNALATKSSGDLLKVVQLVRSFVWKRNDRPTMQSLYDGLSGDLTYTLGVVEAVPDYYKKPGGDRHWLRPGYGVGAVVPVAQLLEKPGDRNARLRVGGYIHSDSARAGFNQLFVKTMVQNGWQPGAAWSPGAVDTMHFDFVKGFDRVQISGGEECSPYGKSGKKG